MKKVFSILLLMSAGIHFANAQSSVAIGDSNPKASAVLYLKGNGSQGLIIPIVANTTSIAAPESGMIVYNSTDKKVYYHDGAAWTAVGSGAAGGGTYTLSLSGNNLLLKDGASTVSTVPITTTAPATANQFLTWDGSKWVATAFTQDAANVNGAITVNGIKGKAIPALPSTTQALVYNGSAWVFQPLTAGTDSQDLSLNTTTNSLSLTNDATPVDLSTYKQTLSITGNSLSISGGNGVALPATGVTSVTAGTGLTGGAITTAGTINVDVGTTANKIVQLDATGKLPAVDGSQLTNLPTGSGDITSVTAGTGLSGGGTTDAVTLNLANTTVVPATYGSASTVPQIVVDAQGRITSATSVAIGAGVSTLDGLTDATVATPASGQVLVNDGAGQFKNVNLSGDVATVSSSGLVTLSPITSAKIADGTIANADIATGAVTSATIADGTIVAADINAMSATNGQVLKFNGTTWAPGVDDAGVGATPTLLNGQILTGNGTTNAGTALSGDATLVGGALTIANNAITSTKIADGTIATADLATGAVTSATIADGTITAADLNAMSATNGQVLKFNGTTWAPAAETGTTYTAGTGVSVVGTVITNTGDTNATDDLTTASTAAGDVTGLFSNLQLASGSVTTTEIADGTITGADLATNINIATTGNITTNAPGNLSIAGTSTLGGAATLTSLAGAGTRMVVANATGVLSTAALPVSGWGLTGNSATIPATNYIGTSDSQPLVFRTNAVEAMRVLTDGSVGIGVVAPTSKLDVLNATGTAIKATTNSNTANSYAVSGIHTGTGDVAGYFIATNTSGGVNSHGVYGQADGAGAGVFGASNGTGGNAARFMNMNASNANPVVQIFNSGTGPSLTTGGAVGIGMTTPTQPLDVAGNVKFSGALMPNNLPGTAGQVLTSAGPGVAPTWLSGGGWSLAGNAGTTAGTNFIGTTDDEAFEVKVNGQRVYRYELNTAPTTAGTLSPNIIAGFSGNTAAAGIKGSVISGGGLDNFNSVDGDWASIGGGRDNHAGLMTPYAGYATIAGGVSNNAQGQWASIGGGRINTATGNASTIPGGLGLIATSYGSTVVGTANVDPGATYSTTTWVPTEPIFIVGNGQITSQNVTSRSNALTVLKNGNVGIANSSATEKLDVTGNVRFSGALMPNNLPGTSGEVLISGGAGVAPTWGSLGGTALGTLNAIPKGNGTSQVASSLTDNGTTVSTTLDFNLSTAGRGLQIAGTRILFNTGTQNIFLGGNNAINSTAGSNSTFIGVGAGRDNLTGADDNTLIGRNAGLRNTTGAQNTVVGKDAGQNIDGGSGNTVVGYSAGASITTGNRNVVIGRQADVAVGATNAIAIGYLATAGASNTMALGGVGANAVKVGIGIASPTVTLDIAATDAVNMPAGTTAQRPGSAQAGAMRFNSTAASMEFYDGTTWQTIGTGGVPTGTISAFGGSTPPVGWLLCDGSAVSRTTYSNLFTAISTAWGAGNGSTTFNLPDLRGRFLRGVDGAAGNDPDAAARTALFALGNTGNDVGTYQQDGFQGHDHQINIPFSTSSPGSNQRIALYTSTAGSTNWSASTILTDGTNGTPRTTSESRPKNANVNFIIKQ